MRRGRRGGPRGEIGPARVGRGRRGPERGTRRGPFAGAGVEMRVPGRGAPLGAQAGVSAYPRALFPPTARTSLWQDALRLLIVYCCQNALPALESAEPGGPAALGGSVAVGNAGL